MIKALEIVVNRALHRNFLELLVPNDSLELLHPSSLFLALELCRIMQNCCFFSGSQALSLARKEEDKYCASCFFLAIYEVGGVPFSVLEPVLEKCTPEQLYRIEECNHVSAWIWGRDADVGTWIDVLRDKEMKVSGMISAYLWLCFRS